jgi:hypothetical protein
MPPSLDGDLLASVPSSDMWSIEPDLSAITLFLAVGLIIGNEGY